MFRSFWMAGFDGTDHLDGLRTVDGPAFRRRLEADYRRVRDVGIECVHESIGWRRAERGGEFDFSSVVLRAQCAKRAGLQVVWTLCHSGWPDDVDVVAPEFPERLRRFAKAAARALAPYADSQPPVYTPVNEISFLSWALAETSLFGPARGDFHNRGGEIKRQLVRAALAGCDAILEVDARARFLQRDAAMTGAPGASSDLARRDAQFETWDMLAGRLAPQLGGHPRYLDIVGVHWHQTNQWRAATVAPWAAQPSGGRHASLARLLGDVHARYRCPLVVSETNRTTAGRGPWLHEFGEGIGEALEHGVPVIGAGLCRAVERAAWEDPRYWRQRRLWDVLLDAGDASRPRASDSAYDQALRDVKARIDSLIDHPHHRYTS